MMKIICFILSLPVVFFTISFAVTNRQPVTLALWPFPFEMTVPVSLAVYLFALVFFVLGGLYFWVMNVPLRTERYLQSKKIKDLTEKVAELQEKQDAASTALKLK